jgi:hypothetical protein
MKQNVVMEDLGQPINNKFPPHYFHREKIISTDPLTFEHIYYYKYDVFQVLETGDLFGITNRAKTKDDYSYERVCGISDLKVGYTTVFAYNVANQLVSDSAPIPGEDVLRYLLNHNDYYCISDLLYDLGKSFEEIPMSLMDFIFKTVYE